MSLLHKIFFILIVFLIISCAQTEDYIENCENTKCSDNAICEMIDDVPVCTCKEGFDGNGIVCTKKENYLWKQTMGGINTDNSRIILSDKQNNIYIAGYFRGNVDFDPGEGTDVHSSGYICEEPSAKCNPSCDLNQECNYETQLCICAKGFHKEEINGVPSCVKDICETECNSKEMCINNECVCKNGYHKNIESQCIKDFECIVSCGENEVCNNGVCECKKGYYQDYFDNSFITKIKEDGTYLWTKTIFSTSQNQILDMAVKENSLFLMGIFKGDTDFDPSSGFDIKKGNTDSDKTFLIQLTGSGSYIDSTVLNADSPTSIVVNDNDTMYITGSFKGEVDFDPDYTGDIFVSNENSKDIFITKLKTDFSYLWTKTIGGTDWDGAESIAVDSKGDIYIVGGFNSTVDFNPTDGIDEYTSNGITDIFITKFSFAGVYQWTKTLGSPNYDMIEDVIIDSEDNVLVVGSFSDTLAISDEEGYDSKGAADIFVSKLDGYGNFLWTKIFGGPQWETYGSIAVDSNDNVYVIGDFMEYIKFDDDIERVSLGGYDIFMAKLDKNGNYLQGRTIGGNNDEYGESINIDLKDNILITGEFIDNIILESTTESFTSNGESDIFIFKIK